MGGTDSDTYWNGSYVLISACRLRNYYIFCLRNICTFCNARVHCTYILKTFTSETVLSSKTEHTQNSTCTICRTVLTSLNVSKYDKCLPLALSLYVKEYLCQKLAEFLLFSYAELFPHMSKKINSVSSTVPF